MLRLHGEPCGRLTINARRGALDLRSALERAVHNGSSDSVLSALARRTAELGLTSRETRVIPTLWSAAPTPPRSSTSSSLTVAICTRDRPNGVERVLASLAAGAARDAYEVLVIDNAPTDGRTRTVAQGHAWARYQVQPLAGLDHARNMALELARGAIVAFADDDVTVDATWSARVRHLFDANPELTLLTGLVEPASLATEAERWFESYGGFGRGYEPRWIFAPGASSRAIAFEYANTGRYGTGANLAVRRVDALRLGGFDPSLDVGTATRGGGDLEMIFRVLKGEGVVAYAPEAMVRHAHRLTWEELASQIESWGSGMVAHLTRSARAHADERLQLRALRTWLYATWFAKRLALSYAYAPFPRALIQRELRGSFRGSALYAEAAAPFPPPAPTPSLHGPRSPTITRAARRDRMLGVDRGPVLVSGVDRIAFRVRIGDRSLGELVIPAVGGVIGETRIRDEVATHWQRELLGGDVSTLRRTLWMQLSEGMRS
ncbi:MAG: glycosyltransferase [Gemmatimonadaceae bacterium]